MTPNQAALVLRATGPMPALDLAHRLKLRPEAMYTALVAGEALGLVRVNVEGRHPLRVSWEAMKEEV